MISDKCINLQTIATGFLSGTLYLSNDSDEFTKKVLRFFCSDKIPIPKELKRYIFMDIKSGKVIASDDAPPLLMHSITSILAMHINFEHPIPLMKYEHYDFPSMVFIYIFSLEHVHYFYDYKDFEGATRGEHKGLYAFCDLEPFKLHF